MKQIEMNKQLTEQVIFIIVAIIFFIFFVIYPGFCQPSGDSYTIDYQTNIQDDDSETYSLDCLNLQFSSTNFGVMNIDCPENTIFNIDVITNQCECKYFHVFIGGKKIKSVEEDGLKNLTFSQGEIYYWTLMGSELGPTFLTIEIDCYKIKWKVQTNDKQRFSYPIQLVKNGQEYTAEIDHSYGQFLGQYKPTEVLDEATSICCNPNKKIILTDESFGKFVWSETSSLNFEGINEKLLGFAKLGRKENNFKITTTFTMDGMKFPEGCQQMGYQIKGEIYTYQKFISNCNLPNIPIGENWALKVPHSIVPKVFPVPTSPKEDCPPIELNVEKNISFFDSFSNKGSLIVDETNKKKLYITWTNKNGELMESPGGNLKDVPFGRYTVTISNKCCEVVTKTYILGEETK